MTTDNFRILVQIFLLVFLSLDLSSQTGEETGVNGITIDQTGESHPYSHLRVNNDPDNFQFAIVTDRTGGHRAGVFEDAIRKLNLLRPEFVISIGDLIEGYTRDEDQIYREWDEFNGFIGQLDLPFFYVPGNHDYENEVQARIWKEKFGPSYYHFVYGNVLFLCLNSEEAMKGSGLGGIEKPQYEYIKKVLDENRDVKWTLVFLHQPLWIFDNTRYWGDVEELLEGRQYTVFAGHMHYYTKYNRNSAKYIVLSTTGGISRLRGPEFGEFDHVAWITMTDEGPVMANLLLKGIWDEDVVTEDTREMMAAERIMIEPVFTDEWNAEAEFNIRITNDEDYPMYTVLRLGTNGNLIPDIVEYQKPVAPNSVEKLTLSVYTNKRLRIEDIERLPLYAWFTYQYEDGREITLDEQYGLAPEKRVVLEHAPPGLSIDGKTGEWNAMPFRGDFHSVVTDATDEYSGDYDASYEFNMMYDDHYIYLGLSVWDDELVIDSRSSLWDQDAVLVNLDARPVIISANNKGSWSDNDFLSLNIVPSVSNKQDLQLYQPEMLPEGILLESGKTLQGFDVEVAIPMDYITARAGENWETVRINIAYFDKDGDSPRSGLWWKPDWSSDQNYIGSGTFFRRQ